MFGALAPDFDHPAAFLSRRLPFVHWIVRLTLSNPITWLLVGRGVKPTAKALARWSGLSWLCYNWLTRNVLGERSAKSIRDRIVGGRQCVVQMMGHRGLSHSVLGTLVAVSMTLVAGMVVGSSLVHSQTTWQGHIVPSWFPWTIIWTLGFGVGYIVHIASDMVTISGVRLGQPWSNGTYWLLPKNYRIRVR